jgi:hypothetical protein
MYTHPWIRRVGLLVLAAGLGLAAESPAATFPPTPPPPTPSPTPTPWVPGSIGRVSLAPVADSYTIRPAPGLNFGSALTLQSTRDDGLMAKTTFLKFDLSTVTVQPLKIYLNVCGWLGPNTDTYARSVDVYGVMDSTWSEPTITWSNQPALGPFLTRSLGPARFSPYVYLTWDLTSYVTLGSGVTTFALLPADGAGERGSVYFFSREASRCRPQLNVYY